MINLKDLQYQWGIRPSFLKILDDKASFRKNRRVWGAYMRLLIAAKDFSAALEKPKKGCQCNAHKG